MKYRQRNWTYKGNAYVKRITELMPMLLDAADLRRSVFLQMFPQLEHATLNRKIDELMDDGLICIQTAPTGDRYLELTGKGEKENSRLRQKKQEGIVGVAKTIGKFMPSGNSYDRNDIALKNRDRRAAITHPSGPLILLR